MQNDALNRPDARFPKGEFELGWMLSLGILELCILSKGSP